MSKIQIINKQEFKWVIRSVKGKVITLEMSDDWTEIVFKDINGKQFGEFEFKELHDGSYKLMRMYTEPHKGEGIGTMALEMFKEVTMGVPVYTSPNDGIVRDDQSHLTEDAPGFVAGMIEAGLIAGYENHYNDEDGFH